ncbi:MAG: MotA/TolQ/ExbB proton channel family protein [Deltaproteobacteria bacterium]|nr:MotA/TolQ/ExbB proton channel family protein [Deltaproteobacteria bacterium]
MIVDYLLRAARIGSEWVLYLLLGLSVLSIAVMVERLLYFRRLRDSDGRGGRDRLRARVAAALRDHDLDEAERLLGASRTAEAGVVRRALARRGRGAAAVNDAVDSELGATKPGLERGLNFMGTLGNNAPFIGLFGTVLGVIEAFHQLGGGPNKAAMGGVMNGIAEALVATGVGLFVALPAVIAFNIHQRRIAEIEDAAHSLGKLVTAALHAAPAAHPEKRPPATIADGSLAVAAEGV